MSGRSEGDCVLGPNDVRLKDVKIELLDANGRVVATTLTDKDGYYHFENLEPGKVYSVRETQPAGYFQGMSLPG